MGGPKDGGTHQWEWGNPKWGCGNTEMSGPQFGVWGPDGGKWGPEDGGPVVGSHSRPPAAPHAPPLTVCAQATEQAKSEVRRALSVLDAHLQSRTFLVGERVSLADISVVCALLWLYKQVRGRLPHSAP